MNRLTLFQLCEEIGKKGYFDALGFGVERGEIHRKKRFVEVEFTLYGGYHSGLSDWPAKDLWAALKGWEELVLPNSADVDRIRRLRLLAYSFQNKAIWEEALSLYLKVEERYRLFTVDESGRFHPRSVSPVVCSDREKIYEKILSAAIPRRKRKIPLARPGECFQYDREETNDQYFVKIPSGFVVSSPMEITRGKKRPFTLPVDFDWAKLGREMDRIREENGLKPVDYAGRMEKLSLVPLNGQGKKSMNITGLTHILGGLGAGKSTWMLAVAYELVKRQGAKVGFIESSVANILKRAEELRALNLSVATIIGTGQRIDHEREYLDRPGLTLEEIASDSSLIDLSSLCLLESLAEDETINNRYPCQRLYKSNDRKKRYACPMASECGLYRQLATLDQADVWIATPASLVFTRIPPQICPDNPTLYEAFYEALDVVFVDEADALQEVFDELFIRDEKLFGDRGHLIENAIRDIRNALHGLYEPGGHFLTRYLRRCDNALDATRCLFQLIKEHPKIQEYLRNRVSFKFQWEHKVRCSLKRWNPTADLNPFFKVLKTWNQSPFRSELWEERHRNGTVWYQKIEDFLDGNIDLQQLLALAPDKSLSKSEIRNIEAECRFYLWLCRLESSLDYITERYPQLLSFVEELEVDLPFSAAKNPLLPHLPTPTLGYRYGYRLVKEEDSQNLVMKLIEYNTVGRFLLYRFPDLFRPAGDGAGPAVILLSGTTLAPRNAHFSLSVTPEWLITSDNKASEITQKFVPITDSTGRHIRVSGMKPSERRTALKELARQLPSLIEVEKNHWKNQRRVLIVTNSYRDSEAMEEVFSRSPLQGRIKSLTRKIKDSIHVTRPRLMEVAKEVDALITPLSAMNRGVNLVDENRKALFGTALFVSRPYPPPQDIAYILSFIHSRIPSLILQVQREGLSGKEALSCFRKICHAIFEKMHDEPNFWMQLSDEERLDLAWYLFVPIWQMAGRLVRGGMPARLLYIDSSFASGTEASTLFQSWHQLFEPYKDHWLYQELYGPFLSSLESLVFEESRK